MIEISIVVFLVLIGLLIFFKIRKKKLANATPQASNESSKPVVQEKPSVKAETPKPQPTEPVKPSVEQKPTPQPVAETVKPVPVAKVVTVEQAKPVKTHALLPEDSSLKRHYVTQLQAMAIAVHGACPSDATLRRHYMAEIAAEVERCSDDKVALERLVQAYTQAKKSVVVECVEAKPTPVVETAPVVEVPAPAVVAEPVINEEAVNVCHCSKIPEDSTLRRHYLTQIKAQAMANLPPCPTDSTLRRHYQSLLDSEIAKLLA